MKKTRFSVLTAALVLGVVGVFATKPAKTSRDVLSARLSGYCATSTIIDLPAGAFTTTLDLFKTVVLATVNGTKIATLVTTGCINRIFKK